MLQLGGCCLGQNGYRKSQLVYYGRGFAKKQGGHGVHPLNQIISPIPIIGFIHSAARCKHRKCCHSTKATKKYLKSPNVLVRCMLSISVGCPAGSQNGPHFDCKRQNHERRAECSRWGQRKRDSQNAVFYGTAETSIDKRDASYSTAASYSKPKPNARKSSSCFTFKF